MKGFVLVNTIYIISIIALLILTLQNTVHLDLQIVNSLEDYHREWRSMEKAIFQITSDISDSNLSNKCMLAINQDSPGYADIVNDGCECAAKSTRYLIKDLGDFLCLRSMVDGNSYATHHYQLYVASKKLASKVLQVRYVLLSSDMPCKGLKNRYVPTGIISWIY